MATTTRRAKKKSYHHGDLRRALVEAAVALVERGGAEAVSVREVARLAGVSSAAPFRHFADRKALLTAVAEEAAARLRGLVEEGLGRCGDDPVLRFRAVGLAHLQLAARAPGLYRLLMDFEALDLKSAPSLATMAEEAEGLCREALAQAAGQGGLSTGEDARPVELAGYALVYGLARMLVDGQLGRVSAAEAERLGEQVLDVLGHGILPREGPRAQ